MANGSGLILCMPSRRGHPAEMTFRIFALQVVLVCLLAGCVSRDAGRDVGPTSYVVTPHGRRSIESSLKRTTAEKWRVHEFSSSGCKVDVPVDAYRVHEDLRGHASIYLHPIAPPGIMDDVQCMVWIEICRKTHDDIKRETETYKHWAGMRQDDDSTRTYWMWRYSIHTGAVSRHDDRTYSYFRHDVACPDESLISMHAEVLNIFKNGKSMYIDEDEKVIRRIMESVQGLNPEE